MKQSQFNTNASIWTMYHTVKCIYRQEHQRENQIIVGYYSWNLPSAPVSHEIRWSVLPPKDWRNLYLLFFRQNFTACQPSEQKQEVVFLERILFLVLYSVVIASGVSRPGRRKRKERRTKNIVKDIYRARVKTQVKLVQSLNRWRELQHLTGSKFLLNLPSLSVKGRTTCKWKSDKVS